MPLQAGTLLGPYEIQSALGAGGMGEVYRAVDSRLRRVAVKVLPSGVAGDPDRLARFEQEARAAAALDDLADLVARKRSTSLLGRARREFRPLHDRPRPRLAPR
jgi:serine/threonine protein kinase